MYAIGSNSLQDKTEHDECGQKRLLYNHNDFCNEFCQKFTKRGYESR